MERIEIIKQAAHKVAAANESSALELEMEELGAEVFGYALALHAEEASA